MGSGLALVFAANGHPVFLLDVEADALAAAVRRIESSASLWLGDAARADLLRLIEPTTNLHEAATHADVAVEAVTEDLETKRALFAQLDQLTDPSAVLCSNTSALPLVDVMGLVAHCERVIGTHWFNPPHLVPAVEIIRAPHTSDATVERVIGLLQALSKTPVEVRDRPGFVANRLQMALMKEAILCVAEGVASAADIDELFSHSIGFRLAAAGPFAIADFAGLDVYLRIFETLAGAVADRFEPPALLRDLVAQGRLGAKTRAGFYDLVDSEAAAEERDRRLLALLRLQRSDGWTAWSLSRDEVGAVIETPSSGSGRAS